MSEELQKQLIGSVEMGKTKGGKEVAKLYSTDRRLEFPVLTLFDLSMLETVGIDPNDLGSDPVYRRFWAYYTESEKETSRGNPYRDVQFLEAITNGSQEATMDLDPVLGELRAIRSLLEILVSGSSKVRKHIPRSVALGASDENADWIADQDTRAGELALHDQLEAEQRDAGPSTLDAHFPRDGEAEEPAVAGEEPEPPAGIPTTGANDMVAYLNRTFPAVQCQGTGHLVYVLKKQVPDWQGWPNSEDTAGWEQVAQSWADYWQAIA